MLSDLIRYRDLLGLLVFREIRVRYARAALGIGWALFLPVVMMSVFTVLNFANQVRDDSPYKALPYPVFAYAGLLPWTYFSMAMTQGTATIANSRELIRKSSFPLEVIPVSRVLAGLVDLGFGAVFLALLIVWHASTTSLGLHAAMVVVPLVLLLQMVFMAGLLMFLAASNVFFRDVNYLVQVGILLAMFATSVIYPIKGMVTEPWLLDVLAWNPMNAFIETYRAALLLGEWPTLSLDPSAPAATGVGPSLLPGLVGAVGALLLGGWTIRNLAPRIAEEV